MYPPNCSMALPPLPALSPSLQTPCCHCCQRHRWLLLPPLPVINQDATAPTRLANNNEVTYPSRGVSRGDNLVSGGKLPLPKQF